MKRPFPLIIVIFLLISAAACTTTPANQSVDQSIAPAAEPTPEPTPEPAQEEDLLVDQEPLTFQGIWFSEDRSSQLIITETNLYYHEFPSNREVYAEVVSVDLVTNILELRMTNILHGGQQMGFDSPMINVEFIVSDGTMQFWLHRLTVSSTDQPIKYLRDEVLNP
jgi:hypothetical protein